MFGIVYAVGTKAIRRIIVPDRARSLADHRVIRGEAMLECPDGPHDLETCKTLVEQATGTRPPDPSCAVVDGRNIVVAMIAADPALDTHPDGELIIPYSEEIGVGCVYARQQDVFIRPAETIPVGTMDKATGRPSTEEVTIPARPITR